MALKVVSDTEEQSTVEAAASFLAGVCSGGLADCNETHREVTILDDETGETMTGSGSTTADAIRDALG